MSDPVWDAAGTELTGLGSDGSSFIVTYGLPVAAVALGAGFVIAMFSKYGKKVRNWF